MVVLNSVCNLESTRCEVIVYACGWGKIVVVG